MPIYLEPSAPATGSVLNVDLVTSTFATNMLSAGNITLSSYQSAMLSTWITAASKEIVRYCQRVFTSCVYDEIVTPEGGRQDRGEAATAMLSAFPIQSFTRAKTGRQQVLVVANTATSTNQYANFSFSITGDVEYFDLTYTGITLTSVASGVTTTSNLLFSTYPTIQGLANAINALGSGWSATVTSTYGLYPSADLVGAREPKNALSVQNGLDLFTQDADSYDCDRSTGILRFYGWNGAGGGWVGGQGDPTNQMFDGLTDYGGGVIGWNQYRFTYTAGWATIPEPLQVVCVEVVRGIIDIMKIQSSLSNQASENTGSWSAKEAFEHLPPWCMSVLNQFRSHAF